MLCIAGAVVVASTFAAQAAEPEAHLKDLAWLIGNWECIEEFQEDAPFERKHDDQGCSDCDDPGTQDGMMRVTSTGGLFSVSS